MPNAVTHVLVVIILLELFRDYFVKNKQAFPLHYVLIGGIAGLLPDLDVAIFYLLSFSGFHYLEVHRVFLHNIFVPLFFVIIALPFWRFKSKELGHKHLKLRNIFLVIAFGVFIHLVLDLVADGYVILFYPFSTVSIGLDLVKLAPVAWQSSIMPSIDAALLILWLIYLEARHKISSFI